MSFDDETSLHGLDADAVRPPAPASRPQDLTGLTLGDFKISRLLGRGGMGEVYLAEQISLRRPVALKVLKPELLQGPKYLRRFEKEAHSAARLNHPNIVQVHAFAESDHQKLIAMEYVPGTNLKAYLEKKGPPPLLLALTIMRQTGEALAAAGEMGIIHRDLKPDNLLLTRKGQVKIADFGLCQVQSPTPGMDVTQEGIVLGTPQYMSPEQVQGKELDPRSDLYSLGVTCYQMLAGRPPFKAETALALALKHVREEPVSLAVHRPDLPPELVALIDRMLRKDPAARPQSAVEFLNDLARVRAGLPAITEPPLTEADSTPISPASASLNLALASTTTVSEQQQLDTERGFRPGRRVSILVLLGALGLGAFLGFWGRSPDLLRPNAAEAARPPGLWLAAWESVPRAPSAEVQYHQALFDPGSNDPVATWLAVVGHFPDATPWHMPAWVQTSRLLFRQGDAGRLKALATEFRQAETTERDSLVMVVEAGVAALNHEPEQVLQRYDGVDVAQLPAALRVLSLEVIDQALREAAPGSATADALDALRRPLGESLGLPIQDSQPSTAAQVSSSNG